MLLARDVARRFASSAASEGRPPTGLMKVNIYKVTTRGKGLLDAKKRAKDSSRIVFSDEQTVAQLVSGEKDAVFEKRLTVETRGLVVCPAGPGSVFHATLCAEATRST